MTDDVYREMRVREASRKFNKAIAAHQEVVDNKRHTCKKSL